MSRKQMKNKQFRINMGQEKPMGVLGVGLLILGIVGILLVVVIMIVGMIKNNELKEEYQQMSSMIEVGDEIQAKNNALL